MILQAAVNLNTQDFFTPGSFTTLAGATGIVYIVCGAIQQAFNYSPKWLALCVSMLISCVVAYFGYTNEPTEIDQNKLEIWVVSLLAILNGFLIYMTATGTNQIVASTTNPIPQIHPSSPNPGIILKQTRKFNSNWFL